MNVADNDNNSNSNSNSNSKNNNNNNNNNNNKYFVIFSFINEERNFRKKLEARLYTRESIFVLLLLLLLLLLDGTRGVVICC